MIALLRNASLLGLWLVIMATFAQPSSAQIEMFLETPAEGERVASVLFVRGWATAPSGIDHVELVINGTSPLGIIPFRIPIGESRPDVKALFPSYQGAANSGFNVGFFFTNSTYSIGSNTVTVTAYDKNGVSRSVSHVFDLRRFETSVPNNFYRKFGYTGRFSIATAQIEGDSILVRDAIIDNQTYDVRLKFNPTLQSFANYDISKVAGPPTINIATGQWGKVDCLNVSRDRTKLTAVDSQCPEGASLYLVLGGSGTNRCTVKLWTKADVPIVYNTFKYDWTIYKTSSDFAFVDTTGVFDSPTKVSGTSSYYMTCGGYLSVGYEGWSMSPK